MAAGRNGYRTPGEGVDRDHSLCPVCGWSPCTVSCRLALTAGDLLELSMMFPHPACDHGEGQPEGGPGS